MSRSNVSELVVSSLEVRVVLSMALQPQLLSSHPQLLALQPQLLAVILLVVAGPSYEQTEWSGRRNSVGQTDSYDQSDSYEQTECTGFGQKQWSELLQEWCHCQHCTVFYGFNYLCKQSLNKPAAKAAGADPSRCNSTSRQSPPIQQNRRNF